MTRRWLLLLMFSAPAGASALAALAACRESDDSVHVDRADAGSDGGAADSADVTDRDASLQPTVLATFNARAGELPFGIGLLGPPDVTPSSTIPQGAVVVGLATLGRVVALLGDGGTQDYATFPDAHDTLTLTIPMRENRPELLVAVAAVGPAPIPRPGIYAIPPGGGVPTPYAVGDGMKLVTAYDGRGYIGDASGKIFTRALMGGATEWKTDEALAGDEQDCKLARGFPMGVSGILAQENKVDGWLYFVNGDKGTFGKIRILPTRDAGALEIIVKDSRLCGANGLIQDNDTFLLVTTSASNSVLRMGFSGEMTTLFSGPPLDGPAGMLLQRVDDNPGRLLIANSAFASASRDAGGATPSVVALPLASLPSRTGH